MAKILLTELSLQTATTNAFKFEIEYCCGIRLVKTTLLSKFAINYVSVNYESSLYYLPHSHKYYILCWERLKQQMLTLKRSSALSLKLELLSCLGEREGRNKRSCAHHRH